MKGTGWNGGGYLILLPSSPRTCMALQCYAMLRMGYVQMEWGMGNGKWVRMDWFVGGLFRVRVEIDFLFFFSLTSLFVPFCLFAD